nr:SDR family NAD(P)-dependent oxidoreductase [Kibdelosporangium phytohabitans]
MITGATSGIGEATARAFAAAGAKVAVCGRRANSGRDIERGIRAARGEATYIQADFRVPAAVQNFVDSAVRRYGRLDIAFNNARGVFLAMIAQAVLGLAGTNSLTSPELRSRWTAESPPGGGC